MTPDQLAKNGSEAAHQTALFAFCAVACQHGFAVAWDWAAGAGIEAAKSSRCNRASVPELRWLHHIPNGGSRGDDEKSRRIRGAQMKAQGVRQGVADLSLPVRRGAWSGLYIEMKKPDEKPKREGSKGGVSDEQAEFGEFVKAQGFGWCVCYSWREAAEVIEQYLTYSTK
jgi:hypothetical protein